MSKNLAQTFCSRNFALEAMRCLSFLKEHFFLRLSVHSHTSCGHLFFKTSLGSVELQEQSRGHGVGQGAEPVAGIDHHIVQKLWTINTKNKTTWGDEYQCDTNMQAFLCCFFKNQFFIYIAVFKLNSQFTSSLLSAMLERIKVDEMTSNWKPRIYERIFFPSCAPGQLIA